MNELSLNLTPSYVPVLEIDEDIVLAQIRADLEQPSQLDDAEWDDLYTYD
ncbi:hypothetical protein P9057_08430 [Gallibacterium anatis]|nr:hypothetical protein [Gallibacterium anatis]